MPKHNIQVLTQDERTYLNNKYDFDVKDDVLIVKVKDYGRVTVHDMNCKFSLNAKVRKITISPEAIQMWHKKFKGKYSLIDVQDAINQLVVTYQTPSDEDVGEQLKILNNPKIVEM